MAVLTYSREYLKICDHISTYINEYIRWNFCEFLAERRENGVYVNYFVTVKSESNRSLVARSTVYFSDLTQLLLRTGGFSRIIQLLFYLRLSFYLSKFDFTTQV